MNSLPRLYQFLESRCVWTTRFIVAKPNGEPLSAVRKDVLREAYATDHYLQPHGLPRGDYYEFGPPARPATTIHLGFRDEFAGCWAELPAFEVCAQATIVDGSDLLAV